MKIKTESPRLTITPGEWYASDLLATTITGFRQMDDIPKVIGAVQLDYRTVRGFPQIHSAVVGCGVVALNDMNSRRMSFPRIDSAAVDSGVVELDDMNFRRTSFPPDEFSTGREGDYIWLTPLASLSVCTRSVTGSLFSVSSHRLVRSCLCSAVLSLRWIESADVPQCRHLQMAVGHSKPDICSSNWTVRVKIYLLLPRVSVFLIICCCFFRIFWVRDMASGDLTNREQTGFLPGTFLGLSLDIKSERL